MTLKSKIHNSLFKVKLIYRNLKAKPVRRKEASIGIERLNAVSDVGKRIFFCGVPMHRNLGDQGQRFCIEKWCRVNYPDYTIVPFATWAFYERDFRKKLSYTVSEDDLFVIQSGYCTTSRHFDHPMHRYIVSAFKQNKILIMPQTVRFITDRDGEKTGRIYNSNKNLLFLARDKVSFESAKKYFSETRVLLYPDIVTTLIGTMKFNEVREGVLLCIRNDGEKKYSDEQITALRKKFLDMGVSCNIIDTNSGLPLDKLLDNFEEELKKTLNFFASHKVVITDRYHGTIFSMISDTPVIVLATKDHKVKTGTEWFQGIYDNAFCNADSPEEAYDMAVNFMKSGKAVRNSQYFKEKYYDILKDKFEKGTL